MLIQFIQMDKKFFHHPALKRRHYTIEIINDLLLVSFEIMGNDLFLIHLVVLCLINEFTGTERMVGIMYRSFFEMERMPFVRDVPIQELYESPAMSEALGRLAYAADH